MVFRYNSKIEIMLAITEAKDKIRDLQSAIGRVIHTAIGKLVLGQGQYER